MVSAADTPPCWKGINSEVVSLGCMYVNVERQFGTSAMAGIELVGGTCVSTTACKAGRYSLSESLRAPVNFGCYLLTQASRLADLEVYRLPQTGSVELI